MPDEMWKDLTRDTVKRLHRVFALNPELDAASRIRALHIAQVAIGGTASVTTARYWGLLENSLRIVVAGCAEHIEGDIFQ